MNIRVIARLDIKGPNLIKGIHLEGLRVIGDPQVFAKKYYEDGADELLYVDSVASLYQRNNLIDIVRHTAEQVFIPLTVGGGVRSVADAKTILRAGADKIAINTAATKTPQLLTELANSFGSQCVVLSIQAKKIAAGKWEVYTNNGRDHTHLDVVEWAKKATNLGAGEILLTSIDQEGTQKGFDCELVKAVSSVVNVPVIASGGFGRAEDFTRVVQEGHASAVAVAASLHYGKYSISQIKKEASAARLAIRLT